MSKHNTHAALILFGYGFYALFLLLVVIGVVSCNGNSSEEVPRNEIPDPPFSSISRINPLEASGRPMLVILIVIDTLRADHIGAYGSSLGLTPFFDTLASQSYLFDDAIAPSSWTRPSVASIFTSGYPGSIGVQGREDILTEDLLTLAEVLNMYGGYECIGISTNSNAGKSIGFAQGFHDFFRPKRTRGYPGGFPLVPADVVTRNAINELKKWSMKKSLKPLFLFLHYVDPHDPYLPHDGLLPTPEPNGRFNGSRSDLQKMDKTSPQELTEEDYARIRYLYQGEVCFCDKWIGEFFKGIKLLDANIFKDMMLIITADHGEGLWDHGWRAHANILYEEQIRVPLLIHTSGMAPGGGQRISKRVSLVDIAPTVLAQCGIPKPRQFQGHDLRPLMRGKDRGSEHDFVYSELNIDRQNFESIHWDNRKLIRNRAFAPHRSSAFKMFDISKDPLEKNDLVISGEKVDWAGKIKKALRKWGDAAKSGMTNVQQIPYEDLDEETLDNLRALGYIGPERHQKIMENRKKKRK
jgi:arylsulfatase A-like enzyme